MTKDPWYADGLKFQCTGCGACCTGEPGYVWLNKAEIEAMAKALGVDVPTFEKKKIRLVGIRKSLTELPNGDCVLLDRKTRTCQVYDVRPRQCRTWPFWTSNMRTPEDWIEMSRDCPGANQGPLVPPEQIRKQLGVMRV